jgi:N-acetylglucosamine malate deacetylase 1
MNLDVLVFAAHPDDAELAMGGTIAKFTNNGIKVGIIDLTRGEMGSRGSADIRQKEAFKAAIILKTSIRENLLIPDGNIELSDKNIRKIVILIRKYRPKIIFAPYFNDRHPDHISASKLTKNAMFVSGLSKVKTSDREVPQSAFRPSKLFYYMQTYTFEPSFIVDISEFYDDKISAVHAYGTQFYNPKLKEPETFISSPEFIEYVKARTTFYGFQIGKKYGEPFYSEEKIELDLNNILKM